MERIIAAWKRCAVLAKDVAKTMDVFKRADTEGVPTRFMWIGALI
jgi:hypothetical protein